MFLLHELPDLVERFGMPDPAWTVQHHDGTTWPQEAYVEVQLWSDDPVRDFLG